MPGQRLSCTVLGSLRDRLHLLDVFQLPQGDLVHDRCPEIVFGTEEARDQDAVHT